MRAQVIFCTFTWLIVCLFCGGSVCKVPNTHVLSLPSNLNYTNGFVFVYYVYIVWLDLFSKVELLIMKGVRK